MDMSHHIDTLLLIHDKWCIGVVSMWWQIFEMEEFLKDDVTGELTCDITWYAYANYWNGFLVFRDC